MAKKRAGSPKKKPMTLGDAGLNKLIGDSRLTTKQQDQVEFLRQIQLPPQLGRQLVAAQRSLESFTSGQMRLMAKQPPADRKERGRSFPETIRRQSAYGPDGRPAVLDRPVDHRRITDTNRKDMMRFPPIAYGLAARIATVVGSFASWSPECEDPIQRALIKSQLESHLHKLVDDSLHGALVYGFAPFELVWENGIDLDLEVVEGEDIVVDKYGIQEFARLFAEEGGSKPKSDKPTEPQGPPLPVAAVKPPKMIKKMVPFPGATVLTKCKDLIPTKTEILVRGKLADFAGLRYEGDSNQEIEALQSFVVTHNGRFGQMYGSSALDTVYAPWYVIEVVTQLCNMYLERKGDPPMKGFAPLIGSWDSDGNAIEGVSLLTTAINAMRSSFGVVLPSDVDPQSGKRKWDIETMNEDPRVDIFVRWIEHMIRMILWGLLVPDGAVWQSGRVGSFASSQTYADLAVSLREIDLRGIEGYLNRYIVPRTLEMNFAKPRHALIQAKTRPDVKVALLSDILKVAMDPKTEPGQLIMNMVDWKNSLKQIGVPTL